MLDISVAYDEASDELGKHRDEHAGAAVLFRAEASPALPAEALRPVGLYLARYRRGAHSNLARDRRERSLFLEAPLYADSVAYVHVLPVFPWHKRTSFSSRPGKRRLRHACGDAVQE